MAISTPPGYEKWSDADQHFAHAGHISQSEVRLIKWIVATWLAAMLVILLALRQIYELIKAD
jgi:hypothetical protein